MATKHKSEVSFTIELDENKIPENIRWTASDAGVEQEEAKALFISVWDPKSRQTLKMDLWTKEMPLGEMKHFFYQTLISMSDTFKRATDDEKMTASIKDFAEYFAEKLELIEKKGGQ